MKTLFEFIKRAVVFYNKYAVLPVKIIAFLERHAAGRVFFGNPVAAGDAAGALFCVCNNADGRVAYFIESALKQERRVDDDVLRFPVSVYGAHDPFDYYGVAYRREFF